MADTGPTEVLADHPSPPRRRVAPFVALGVAAVIAAFVAIAATRSGGPNETADTPLLDQPAPAVQTTTLDGAPFDLGTRRGSWVVLNFFSTECPPCVREHPELVRFARQQEAEATGVELLTVIHNDESADVQGFFDAEGGGWPVLTDPDGRISVGFGVAKVPETWVIDPAGVIRARVISTVTAEGLNQLVGELQSPQVP